MDSIKILLLISILFIYPLLPGSILCCKMGKKSERQGFASAYVSGSLLCGALCGALSFVCVHRGWSLERTSSVLLVFFAFFAVVCVGVFAFCGTCRSYVAERLLTWKKETGKGQILLLAAYLSVALLYVVRPFPMETGFDTPERVVTILDTGVMSGTDALTGEPAVTDGNWKNKVCNLPLFYACLCRWMSLSPADVLFSVVPYVVLLLAFCVISLWADFFFSGEKRGKDIALLLFALITLCGNAAYMNTSYGLLHFPYEGFTIFSSILLPLVGLCVLERKNTFLLMLAAVNMVFAGGVVRAVAVLGLVLVCILAVECISFLTERRTA